MLFKKVKKILTEYNKNNFVYKYNYYHDKIFIILHYTKKFKSIRKFFEKYTIINFVKNTIVIIDKYFIILQQSNIF